MVSSLVTLKEVYRLLLLRPRICLDLIGRGLALIGRGLALIGRGLALIG